GGRVRGGRRSVRRCIDTRLQGGGAALLAQDFPKPPQNRSPEFEGLLVRAKAATQQRLNRGVQADRTDEQAGALRQETAGRSGAAQELAVLQPRAERPSCQALQSFPPPPRPARGTAPL